MKNKKKSKQPYFVLLMVVMAFAVLFIITGSTKLIGQGNNTTEDNPLLTSYDTPFNVPPFEKIKTGDYLPAIKEAIRQREEAIQGIVSNTEPPTFENTIVALDNSGIALDEIYGIFYAVKDTETNDEMDQLGETLSSMMTSHRDDVKLNEKLFQRIKTVYDQRDKLNLSEEQLMLVEKYYKNHAREGANLTPDQKTKLKQINSELATLMEKYGVNVLKETNSFQLVVDKKDDLEGLPQALIDTAANVAAKKGLTGKWVFTLHRPSIFPFLQFSKNRAQREKIFKAYISRGNNGNQYDNKALLVKIMTLRQEKAKLLGYENFAEFALEQNMTKNAKTVYEFLEKLWKPALEMSKKEAKEYQALIDKEGGKFKLQPWDWWYYSEKYRKEKYNLEDQELKPYFKLENVRDGAFYAASKLYCVRFIPLKDMPTYNKDVQVYEVQEANGMHIGILYIDYFQRSTKQGGAWASILRSSHMVDGKLVPNIVTNCHNFAKPAEGKPCLLNLDEVRTLFHEFGHALHGLFYNGNYYETQNVPQDFVELPSKIMENWSIEPEMLAIYAKHYETGKPMPKELIDKISNSLLFNKGFEKTEALAAALLDMDFHVLKDTSKLNVEKFEKDFIKKIGLISEIVPRYRSTYYTHIFGSGGAYAAGYYSYSWSEYLDADAFEAFKEGGIFNSKVGNAFRTNILSKGGNTDVLTLYKRFRGAEPKLEPLLKRNGFIK